MIDRFRKFSYFLAYAVATIPLWHYIRDGRILTLMVAVIIFAYIMVVISSVQASQTILSGEKPKITFPRWLPDKTKYRNWWSLSRHSLKWHLLLVPPKLALSLAFVQFFHSHWLDYGGINALQNRLSEIIQFFLSPYVYFSFRMYFTPIAVPDMVYPQWQTVIIGLIILIVFTVAKSGLVSSLILLIHTTQNLSLLKKNFLLIGQYLIIVFAIIGFLFTFVSIYCAPIPHACSFDISCTLEENTRLHEISLTQYRLKVRIGETLHAGIFTLIGDGVLLSSNVMRPVGDNAFFARTEAGTDNRPFVARQVVAGLLGLILYAGTTWVILWFVEDEPEHEVT